MPRKIGGKGSPPPIQPEEPKDFGRSESPLPRAAPEDYFERVLDSAGYLPKHRVPPVARLLGVSSSDDSDAKVARFRTTLKSLDETTFDYLRFEQVFKDWQNLWSELPDPGDKNNDIKWRQFLAREQGQKMVISLLRFTEKVLQQRPNWGGVLIDCHKKISSLTKFYGYNHAMGRLLQDLQIAIVSHVDIQYLAFEPDAPFSLINPALLEDENGGMYGFNLGHHMFRYSLGHPVLERRFVQEWLHLLKGQFERFKIALLARYQQLLHLTTRERFTADNAITVRDYGPLVGLESPFYLMATSTLFPSDIWTSVSASGFLKRAKQSDLWRGKSVLEIGTGKGILPLLIAEHTRATTIDSVDVNPDAQHVAQLNTYYRRVITDRRDLTERIRYYHTDNLDDGAPKGKKYDVIVGCIPQAPSAQKNISDRDKADVYPMLDYPEDIDGFGLLANMLERGIGRLNPGGEILLTVSGRPANEAVVKMANLRGYVAEAVVEEMILQHKGTDLSRYVEIEKSGSRTPFEFWVGDQKLTATEAKMRLDDYNQKYLRASQTQRLLMDADPYYAVSHKLYVMRFKPLKDVNQTLAQQALLKAKDYINTQLRLGYFNETGSEFEPFRLAQADYLSSVTGVRVHPQLLFVAPSLSRLIANTVFVTAKNKKIHLDAAFKISDELKVWLKKSGFKSVDQDKASMLIVSLKDKTPEKLKALLESAHKKQKHLFLVADINSGNQFHFVTNYLVDHPEAARFVAISWQNHFVDNPLATLILPNKQVYEAMQNLGKDTYSRTSLRSVFEWASLEVLRDYGLKADFSVLPRVYPVGDRIIEPQEGSARDVSPEARGLAAYPAHPPKVKEKALIDLSFGESEYLIPEEFLAQMKAALDQEVEADEVNDKVLAYLNASGLESNRENVVLGAGVHPLIQQTLLLLTDKNKSASVLLPVGHYGQFPPTIASTGLKQFSVDLHQGDVTDALTAAYDKAKALGVTPKMLLLQYPVNPSGVYYSREQLEAIVGFAQSKGIYLLVDEIFLETSPEAKVSVHDLVQESHYKNYFQNYLVFFGGTSKDMGWGMARFGYAHFGDAGLAHKLRQSLLEPVDKPARQLAALAYDASFRGDYLLAHNHWLQAQRQKMIRVLDPFAQKGLIKYQKPEGGYFVEVDVSALLGKTVTINDKKILIQTDGSNLRDILKNEYGLLISQVGWAGNPKTIRLVYSIQQLDEALKKLKSFLEANFVDDTQRLSGADPVMSTAEPLEMLSPISAQRSLETLESTVPEFLREEKIKAAFSVGDPDLDVSEVRVIPSTHNRGIIKVVVGPIDESSAQMLFHYQIAEGGFVALHIDIIQSKQAGQLLGARLIHQVVQLARSYPKVVKVDLKAVHQGRFAWGFLDGFKLSGADLKQIKKRLNKWAKIWGWPAEDSLFSAVDSPYRVGKLYDLGRTFPGLVTDAMKAYESSSKSGAERVLQTRYPGRVALLLNEDNNHNPVYEIALSVRDDIFYARYLISFIRRLEDSDGQSVQVLTNAREALKALTVSIYPEVTVQINQGQAGGGESPDFFINPEEYKEKLKSIDGEIGVSDVVILQEADQKRTNVVLDFKTKEGGAIGSMCLSYVPDQRHTGKWLVVDSFIHMDKKWRNKKYGMELRTQILRMHYSRPEISGWQVPVSEDGLRIWKHLDGVVIKKGFVERVRYHLTRMNETYNIGFDIDLINGARTILDFAKEFVLDGPHEALQRDAAKAFSNIKYDDNIELTKNVGEMALRLAIKESELKGRPLQGFLDLSQGNQSYRQFLGSLRHYWSARSLAVPRAPALVLDLDREEEKIKNELLATTPYPMVGAMAAVNAATLANKPQILR